MHHGNQHSLSNSEGHDDNVCIVCMDAPVEVQLWPCSHSILCQHCSGVIAARSNQCPKCRADLTGIVFLQS